jgi:hypothetical protein
MLIMSRFKLITLNSTLKTPRRVVVDLELGRGFGFGLPDLDYSGFEIAVTWDDLDGFVHWEGISGRALLHYLLEHTEIVGFNLLAYDNKVLQGYLQPREAWLVDELKRSTVDLHNLLLVASGVRYSLQEVASNTLGEGKLTPPEGYDPLLLADYCERDVELTRDLDDFRRAYGLLYVRGGQAIMLPSSKVIAHAGA